MNYIKQNASDFIFESDKQIIHMYESIQMLQMVEKLRRRQQQQNEKKKH